MILWGLFPTLFSVKCSIMTCTKTFLWAILRRRKRRKLARTIFQFSFVVITKIKVLKHVVQSFQMTDDQDYLFPDASFLCEGNCAPPTFNIPPPPRPPWMEELEDCSSSSENQKISEWLSEVHSCDNTLIRDSQTYFEDTFHSIAIIVVSAIILVIIFLAFGLYLFR